MRLRARAVGMCLGVALAGGCGASASGGASGTYPGSGGATGSGGSTGTTTGGGGTNASPPPYGGAGGDSSGAGGTTSSQGGETGSGGATGIPMGGSSGAAGSSGTGGVPGSACIILTRLVEQPMCAGQAGCPETSPSSFDGLQAGPSSVLRVQASAQGYSGRWDWLVNTAGGASTAKYGWTPVDAMASTIDIKLGQPGTYDIQPLALDRPSCTRASLPVYVSPPASPQYLIRATPPTASRLPTREMIVNAVDIGTSGGQVLDLGAANAQDVMSLSPRDPSGFPLPAYVRVTSPGLSFDYEGFTGAGPLVASLEPSLAYDVLVIPNDPSAPWPPMVVHGLGDSFHDVMKLGVSPGIPVAGVALDAAGNPVTDVRVLLRQDARPSTLGTSAADGTFQLATREGTVGAVISPPPGLGLAEAHLAASPGITLAVGTASLDLRMRWASIPSAAVTVTAHGPGGAAIAGARVRVENTAEIPAVGTLHVTVAGTPAVDVGVTGGARVDGVTDALGVAKVGALPVGSYHVTVSPPDGAALAVTSKDVTVAAAGLTTDVSVGQLATMSGTLSGPDAAAGWRLSALDTGPLAPATVPRVMVGADGRYALPVSPGRPYEIVVDAVSAGLSRTFVLATAATAAAPPPGAVPGAVTWPGAITSSGVGVPGVRVDVFCVPSPSSPCLDGSIAVAQGVSSADGSVTLSLPSLLAP